MTPINRERALIGACEQLRAKVDALADTLREIATQDPVELMLDPQWPPESPGLR